MLLAATALGAVDAVTKKLECVDAARDAALAAARGGDGQSAGRAGAPAGSRVSVTIERDTVIASVAVIVHPMGRLGPGIVVSGDATAAVEPGVQSDDAAPRVSSAAAESRESQ
jgi:hypothetical protein